MKLDPEKVDLLVIHCSATREHQDIRAADIDRMHKDRGWSGIGYHRVICRDGIVENGRPLDEVGAHAKGVNSRSVSICLVGGLADNGRVSAEGFFSFTDAQQRALKPVIQELINAYPGITDILGHRDLSPDLNGDGIIDEREFMKECPTFDVRAWVLRNGPFIPELPVEEAVVEEEVKPPVDPAPPSPVQAQQAQQPQPQRGGGLLTKFGGLLK